jgi:hypothetical protein
VEHTGNCVGHSGRFAHDEGSEARTVPDLK